MDDADPQSTPPPGWHDDPHDPTSLRYWDGENWTDQTLAKPPTTLPPPPLPAARSAVQGWEPSRIIAAVGAAAVVVGSLGPWATASTPFGSIDVNGTEGDGKVTLILGAVALGFILLRNYLVAMILSAIAGAILVFDFLDVSRTIGDVDNEFIKTSVGWGLFVGAIGGVLAFVGSLLLWRAGRVGSSPAASGRG
jgi:Protein of unknown function (DUF2510)